MNCAPIPETVRPRARHATPELAGELPFEQPSGRLPRRRLGFLGDTTVGILSDMLLGCDCWLSRGPLDDDQIQGLEIGNHEFNKEVQHLG